MKKLFGSIALTIVAVVMVASGAMAYQATLNVTGERMQSTNATVGTVQAAYYNPAGLVTLAEGFYIDLGNRILGLNKTAETDGGIESESETWTFLLPNAAFVWRVGNGALFVNFGIFDGGAGGSWDDADSMTVLSGNSVLLSSIEGTSYTYGVTLGGSAKLNDMLSFSGAVRYLQYSSVTEYEGAGVTGLGLPESTTSSAYGWQGVFGIMLTPMQGLNVTVQYTTETVLTGKKESELANGMDITTSSVTEWKPNMLQFGIGYEVAQGVEIQLSYNLTLDGESFFAYNERSGGKYDDPSHMIGIGAQYRLMDLLAFSFGMSYHIDGTAPSNGRGDPTNPQLDKLAIGAGVVITPMQNLNIEASISYSFYFEDEGRYTLQMSGMSIPLGNRTTNQNALVFGLGVSYGLSM